MPSSAEELVELLDLETIDLNLFAASSPTRCSSGVRRPGRRAGAGRRGAHRRAADGRALAAQLLLRPGDTAVPIVYDVERIRDGRSFSTRRVVRQHGRPIYYMTLSFQLPEDGFEHQDVMPDVPSPEESPDMGEMFRKRSPDNADEWLREWAALELRWVGDSSPGRQHPRRRAPSQSRLWIKVSGTLSDDPLIHQAAFTYASDMTLLVPRWCRTACTSPTRRCSRRPSTTRSGSTAAARGRVAALRPGVPWRPAPRPGHRPGVQRRRRAGRHGGPGGPDPAPRLTPAAGTVASAADRRTRRLRSHGVWCTVITPPVPSTVWARWRSGAGCRPAR